MFDQRPTEYSYFDEWNCRKFSGFPPANSSCLQIKLNLKKKKKTFFDFFFYGFLGSN